MIRITPAMFLLLLVAGCTTAAGGSGDTGYATYRLVQDMDANVRSTLEQINQTTAEISVRVDESERALRELKSVAQENQVRLDRLQASLDSLTTTLYRHFNLTPPPSVMISPGILSDPGAIESGEIMVQPPAAPPAAPFPDRATSALDLDQHYGAAQDLYGTGDYEAALVRFAEHTRLYPQSPHAGSAQYWKAHCHFKMGHFEDAIGEFERLRSDFPTSNKVPTAMHNQAVAYSRLGQSARAEALFRRLIAEYPDDAAAQSARDRLRQLQGLD